MGNKLYNNNKLSDYEIIKDSINVELLLCSPYYHPGGQANLIITNNINKVYNNISHIFLKIISKEKLKYYHKLSFTSNKHKIVNNLKYVALSTNDNYSEYLFYKYNSNKLRYFKEINKDFFMYNDKIIISFIIPDSIGNSFKKYYYEYNEKLINYCVSNTYVALYFFDKINKKIYKKRVELLVNNSKENLMETSITNNLRIYNIVIGSLSYKFLFEKNYFLNNDIVFEFILTEKSKKYNLKKINIYFVNDFMLLKNNKIIYEKSTVIYEKELLFDGNLLVNKYEIKIDKLLLDSYSSYYSGKYFKNEYSICFHNYYEEFIFCSEEPLKVPFTLKQYNDNYLKNNIKEEFKSIILEDLATKEYNNKEVEEYLNKIIYN